MSKYIPTKIANSIYDIDYNELYASGKRIILFDLDNTLISYYEDIPNQKLIEFGKMLLSSGFKVYVLSNNRGKRIGKFLETFPATDSGNLMKKPFAYKIKKFLKRKFLLLSYRHTRRYGRSRLNNYRLLVVWYLRIVIRRFIFFLIITAIVVTFPFLVSVILFHNSPFILTYRR